MDTLLQNKNRSFENGYVSVNSKPEYPPPPPTPSKPPMNFLKGRIPYPGHKESAKSRSLGQKNHAKTPPPGQLFSKIQQRTKHRNYEKQYWNTNMFRNIKAVKQNAQTSLWVAFIDIQNISSLSPFIYKLKQ